MRKRIGRSRERDRGRGESSRSVDGLRRTVSARACRRSLASPDPRFVSAPIRSAPGDQTCVSIATQGADGSFVDERLRDALFRVDAGDAELREPRADSPLGKLAWFEVARLGLREPV